jgi:hypothetical protein
MVIYDSLYLKDILAISINFQWIITYIYRYNAWYNKIMYINETKK